MTQGLCQLCGLSLSVTADIDIFPLSVTLSMCHACIWAGRFVATCTLTHYQTTNFRLFQTERDNRPQFQISQKWQKVIQTGRKHCGKRRNCSLQAISPFPTVFSNLLEIFLPFSSSLRLSSANSFSLEESRICHSGKS